MASPRVGGQNTAYARVVDVQLVEEPPAEWVVVALRGDLDLGSLPALRSRLAMVEPGRRGVIVDLDTVDVLEPEALGVLLGLAARLRRRGLDLRAVATADRHLDLLGLTGVDRAMGIHRSIVDATDSSGRNRLA